MNKNEYQLLLLIESNIMKVKSIVYSFIVFLWFIVININTSLFATETKKECAICLYTKPIKSFSNYQPACCKINYCLTCFDRLIAESTKNIFLLNCCPKADIKTNLENIEKAFARLSRQNTMRIEILKQILAKDETGILHIENELTRKKSIKWIKLNCKKCPNCAITIHKDDGCNHIRCTKCNYDFCWKCNALWKNSRISHICEIDNDQSSCLNACLSILAALTLPFATAIFLING